MAGEGTAWQIPMSAKLNVPDIPGSLARGMDLEQKQIETADVQQQFQDQQNDKQVLTDYTKQGGDLYTPQGIDKAKEDLRGKVSFNTYGQIAKQADALKQHDIDMREKILKFNSDETKNFLDKNNAVLGALVPITESYKADAASQGEQEAQANFEKNKAAKLKELSAAKDSTGQPLFTPEQIQAFGQMDYKHLAAAVTVSKPYHDLAETRLKESQSKEAEALAKKNAEQAGLIAATPAGDKLHVRELQGLLAQHLISQEFYDAMLKKLSTVSGAGSSISDVIPPEAADLHGDAYLSTLPTGMASTVKKISDGDVPLSTVTVRGGQREAMEERVAQYNPGFSATDYPTKQAVKKDFTSGPTSRNITSINTAIGHAGTLEDYAQAMGGTDVKLANKVINYARTELGHPEVNNLDMARLALGDELMKTFRGAGASELEAEAWRKRFDTAGSPQQIRDAAKTAMALLASRIDSLDDQWKRGMATDDGYPDLLSKHSRETIRKIDPSIADRYKESAPRKTPNDYNHPTVPKSEQKAEDSDAVAILMRERDETADKLTGEKDPAEKARIQADVAALDRELVAARKKAGIKPPAGNPADTPKKRVYDPATGTFK